MAATIQANGVVLPSPVEIGTSEEIIWSANTGRSTTGLMVGDVVAEKRTLNIRWGVLTAAEYDSIRSNIRSGFHPFTLTVDGAAATITAYRGAITGTLLGTYGGVTYYNDVSVSVIQQ